MISFLQHRWTGLYLLLLALGSLLLFLYGFFPLKYHTGEMAHWDDLPNFIDGVSIDGHEVYNAGENSVVLMVIDGLRYDFVTEEYMPFSGQLIKNKTACLYVSVAEPPTVTMPRIKAMMTGSVSTFADVALNFGAPAVRGDSVLRVAKLRGRKTVMYGDDTWLRLFPDMWDEHDGTTSFYVTDYTEVDNNVTRHLDTILAPVAENKPKFDFLVLHYLGLDHIGHLEGARSPKIKPKLIEMDDIVKKIFNGMQKWDRPGVLIVCGDHGMRDAGGHGGATPAEVLVPLLVIRTHDFVCPHNTSTSAVSQTSVCASVSWLLRAPLPSGAAGAVLPALRPIDTRQHLYLMHYAGERAVKDLERQVDGVYEREFYKQFKRAEKQFAHYLSTGEMSAAHIAREFYEESLDQMTRILNASTVDFDVFAIITAVVLLYSISASLICVTLYSLQQEQRRVSVTHHRKRSKAGAVVAAIFIFICFGITLTLACAITETNSNLCSIHPLWSIAFAAVAITLCVTFFVTKTAIEQNLDLSAFKQLNAIDYLLIIGTLFHSWSFFGTSFIEEEHMTWYFYWNTLMFFVLIRTVVVVVMYFSKKYSGATELQDKPQLENKMAAGVSILPTWVLLIALHRYLRTMNQTGDRWLFLPDTADWLNAPENAYYLQAHLVIGTILTLAICMWNLQYTNNLLQVHSAFTILATACIIAYRVASNSLDSPFPSMKTWDSVIIVDVFWGILAAQMVFEIMTYVGIFRSCGVNPGNPNYKPISNYLFVYSKPKAKTEDYVFGTDDVEPWNLDQVKLNLAKSISHLVLNYLMLIVILLMRPHNVIMVPSIYITCKLTTKCLDHKLLDGRVARKTDVVDVLSQTLVHLWIGSVFFFYQGNSNSLSSVDLSAGYVGLRAYSPSAVAVRMGLHAFAAHALSGALLLANLADSADQWDRYLQSVWRVTNIFACHRVYTLCVYLVVATVFRHHLFVWSVFSPKILYDFVSTIFTVQALVTIAQIIGLTHLTSSLAKALTFRTKL